MAVYCLKEDYKREAYRNYTSEMLYACASSLGAQIETRYRDLVAEVEHPDRVVHEATVEEAQACFEKALADSRKAAEENGGEEL